MAARVIEEFGDVFEVLVNKKRMGQLFSIDKAYSIVATEYIFHCEDDWVLALDFMPSCPVVERVGEWIRLNAFIHF